MDFTDGNTVSVKGNDSHFLSVDLEKLTAHQFIVVIVRDGKDRLTDHFLQGILGNNDGFVSFNHGKVGKIFT